MKPVVMQLLTTLHMGGAERLALSILHKGGKHFDGIIAGLFRGPGELACCASSLGLPGVALQAENCGKAAAVMRLYKALRRHNVSLLHIQAGYLMAFALPAAKMARIPLVYTEHATHSLQRLRNIRLAVRLGAPFIQGVVCVNAEVARYFREDLGVKPEKIKIIANGVDADIFSPSGPAATLPWDNEEGAAPFFVFGTVARLCEAKDHPNLLRAFALVAERHPQARLLLVGDGEMRAETEKLARSLQLREKVHITGTRLDIPEWLRSMDAFVLSSKREGLPMALLEALACNLPVISTDAGGIPELNNGGERLLLTPTENSEALAAAMETLLTDAGKRRALAESGRAYVLAERTDEVMANAYYQIYKEGGLR